MSQSNATATISVPKSRRLLDNVYITYLALSLTIALLIDLQPFYPPDMIPQALKDVNTNYMISSGDPLVGRRLGGVPQMAWFDSFLFLEASFQAPTFVLGLYGLLKGYESIRILLLAYGASTATTLLPCLYTVFVTPPTAGVDGLFLTGSQKQIIYMSYVPFLVVPLLMAVDSAVKLWSVVRAAEGGVKRRVVSDVKKAQ